MHGIPVPQIEQLAGVIAHEVGKHPVVHRYNDLLEHSPELGDFFHSVVISERGLVPHTRVEIPAGGALPLDGRRIEDGIRHKWR